VDEAGFALPACVCDENVDDSHAKLRGIDGVLEAVGAVDVLRQLRKANASVADEPSRRTVSSGIAFDSDTS
jgi:hypothetical protein